MYQLHSTYVYAFGYKRNYSQVIFCCAQLLVLLFSKYYGYLKDLLMYVCGCLLAEITHNKFALSCCTPVLICMLKNGNTEVNLLQ